MSESNAPLQDLSRYHPAIYVGGRHDAGTVVATATLVKLNGLYFCLTAGHVYRDWKHKDPAIFIEERGLGLSLGPRPKLVTTGENDPYDVLVAQIEYQYVDQLQQDYRFFDIGRYMRFSNLPGSGNVACGYPVTKQKTQTRIAGQRYRLPSRPYFISVGAIEILDKRWQPYNKELFHLAEIVPKRAIYHDLFGGKRCQLPKLNGFSGGGLWHLSGLNAQELTFEDCMLLGILIESHAKNGFLLAVSWKLALEGIAKGWPKAMNA